MRVIVLQGLDLAKKDIFGLRYGRFSSLPLCVCMYADEVMGQLTDCRIGLIELLDSLIDL